MLSIASLILSPHAHRIAVVVVLVLVVHIVPLYIYV